MSKQKRNKTNYPGVFFIEGSRAGKSERIYYISFYKDGKKVEEKAGRQFKDNMSPAKANRIRSQKIDGILLTNKERRQATEDAKKAEADKWTIDRLWTAYKESKPDLKGIVTDQSRYEKYLAIPFGGMEPKEILPLDVKRLEINLLKKKAPATVRNILELLRRISNFAIKKQLCPGIGFVIEMPKVNNLKTEDLSFEQIAKLLKVIEKDDHPQAGTIMKLALFSGMRRGEMFKLKWKHVDFEGVSINIKDPKGGQDQAIPLNDSARELLENHPRTEGSPFVFPGRGGNQRVAINKAVNVIKKKAGLPEDFRPLHGLRHTYATTLANSGKVDMYVLQKLLTHKGPAMTQRYAHLRDETLKNASNIAGDIFKQAGEKKENKPNVINLQEK